VRAALSALQATEIEQIPGEEYPQNEWVSGEQQQ